MKVKLDNFSYFPVVDRSDLKVLEAPLAQLETPLAQWDPSDELSSGDAATSPVVVAEAIPPPDVGAGEVSVSSAAAIPPVTVAQYPPGAEASAVVYPPLQ